jgi:hypothetical protein
MHNKLIILFWVSFLAVCAIYAIMVLWSLPKISAAAGGLAPFDMRPGGYSLEDARSFLSGLSEEGRAFYLSTQHRLDTVYPPLLGLTLALGLWIMSPTASLWLRLPLVALAMFGMLADLVENQLVAVLLSMPPGSVDAEPVMMASAATVIKSFLTTIAMSLLLVFTAVWGWAKWWRT